MSWVGMRSSLVGVLVCASCGHVNSEGAKFCEDCGFSFAPVPAGAKEQRKTVTVLFCDLTGSTALGETLDPERLRVLLARYFERMKAIVERHGGSVEKFSGDAVMAVYGVPVLHEDDALRALRAATEMRDALPDLGLQGRIGVMTGEVVTGTEERLATGDAVNVAARLEQAAEPGEVLIGAPTLALAGDAAEVEPVEPLVLRGKAEPVPAYRLLSVRDAPERRHEALFVGRERELALLREAWERVQAEQRCELVTLVGDAGVGKSRLVAELLEGVEAAAVRGRCLPYGEGITYWPVVEVLKQLDVLPADEAAALAIRSLLGQTEAATSAEEIAWAFRKTLEQAAAERPLVVVFDDLQWGEQTFLDLVEHVALLSSSAPILLLCIARPELLDRRSAWGGGKLNASNVLLEPLSSDETQQLIERLPAGAKIDAGLRERILEAAGGNPLFVGEMLAMLADRSDGNGSAEIAVPPTIQALLASRLDQLDDAERRVLERGAVEGHVFHRGAVVALAPEEGQVDGRLMTLVRKDLVRPEQSLLAGDDAFRFRHLLIRDAAYEALPKATRAELHQRFADWLEQNAPELVELDEIVGYHLEQAYTYRSELGPLDDAARVLAPRAAERLLAAAKRALDRGDLPAVESMSRRSVVLAHSGSTTHREAQLQLARVLLAIGEVVGARELLKELVASAEHAGDAASLNKARLVELELRIEHDPTAWMGDALVEVGEAESELARVGDDEGQAWAARLAGNFSAWLGRTDDAERAWARGLEHARRAGSSGQIAEILAWRCWALWWGPTPAAEGVREADEIIEQATGHPPLKAIAMLVRGCLKGFQGHIEEGRSELRAGRALFFELGDLQHSAGTGMIEADLELAAGNPAAADAVLQESYEFMSKTAETGYLATIVDLRAVAALDLGREDAALALADEVERIASPDDFEPHVRQACVRARVLARRGDHDAAAESIQAAAAIGDKTDYLSLREYVAISRAEVERLAGRPDAERAALDEALRLAEAKEDVLTAGRVRELLGRLNEPVSP